eukprot:91006_1
MADQKDEAELGDDGTGYKVGKKVGVQELMQKDADDESLAKYKAELLGTAESAQILEPDNPNCVIIRRFGVVVGNEEKYGFEPSDDMTFVLKEGCEYQLRIEFHVQRDIVSGLKYDNKVYKKIVRVVHDTQMVGSYAPANDKYTWTSEIEEAPSGFLARGDYKAVILLLDDDKNQYGKIEYKFSIKKDW